MTERLDEAVNDPETVIMRAARLAYRLGRQDQQRMLERALRQYFGDDEPANILRDLAVHLPHEPVSFQAIVWAAEGDSTWADQIMARCTTSRHPEQEPAIPLCERCRHKAAAHAVNGELRECMEWSCSCEQYEHPIDEVPR